MKFEPDFIDKVRDASNIVDVIGQFVQLKRSSGNYMGLCPFHGEKSASFSVSEDKQVYHCFGCKAGGNVFHFIQQSQGMTFPESIEYLARRAAIPLPESSQQQGAARDHKTTLYRVNEIAAQFYHQELLMLDDSHPVKQYCAQRGLSKELIALFKLGYAPDEWSALSLHFESKKVSIAAAEEVGLIKRRTGGKSGHYDLFRHRLMFPIHSPLGHCLGFGGRVLRAEDNPKYVNSTDSIVFHKGKIFYGLQHSAKHIRAEDYAIVVEGYMDWLALVKAGIHNVVATLGTALTHDHAKLLLRYTQKAVILFDGDTAGRLAAERSLPILLSEGVFPSGLFLPDELDPDEFIQERGVPALKKHLAQAPDLFELIAEDKIKATKLSPTGKIQVLDELAPILAQAKDSRLRQLYGQSLADQLQLETKAVEQSVRAALQKAAQAPASGSPNAAASVVSPRVGGYVDEKPAAPPPQIELKGAPVQELDLLNISLAKEVYLKEVLGSQILAQLTHSGVRRAFERIQEVYGQMPSKFDNLSALLADEIKPFEMITRHLSEPMVSLKEESAKKLIQDCIKRVREKFLRAQSKELVSNLRSSHGEERSAKLEQIMNVQKSRRNLDRES